VGERRWTEPGLTRAAYGITVIPVPTLTFKVTPAEAARIRRLARRAGRSVSEFLRRRAAEDRTESGAAAGRYQVKRSSKTGLPVMHAPRGTPRVTAEEVKALLADFP